MMKSQYRVNIRKLFDIFFGDNPNRGDTSPQLRRLIEDYAHHLSGDPQATATIPADLEGYVRKVTLYAHQVTDEDIAALKARGYTEDELFEITISAALGAGRTRLEAGLAALNVGDALSKMPSRRCPPGYGVRGRGQ